MITTRRTLYRAAAHRFTREQAMADLKAQWSDATIDCNSICDFRCSTVDLRAS